jgi:hypothetical protein
MPIEEIYEMLLGKGVRRRRRRKGRVIRAAKRQIGTSKIKYDRRYAAMRPGLRQSGRGKRYYERRRNRSDINPRKKL